MADYPDPIRPIDCQLVGGSFGQHLTQIYAGFAMLASRGLVQVSVIDPEPAARTSLKKPKLEVRLNGKLKLIYDKADGVEYFEEDLAACDLYFKRSYDADYAAGHKHGNKVLPIGLSYCVYFAEDFWLRRMLSLLNTDLRFDFRWVLRQSIRSSTVLSRLTHSNQGQYFCQLNNFEGFPVIKDPPRVILLTQTWDPSEESPDRVEVDERHLINQMRAGCIRNLRREHGKYFVGGFSPSPYAIKHFPDCVVDEPLQTRKDRYLQLVHGSSICVTTMGLLGSNGSRLGEYVAAAKAIVTERLCFGVAGDFRAGMNYLEFTNPNECVAATVALVDDRAKRLEMMERNHRYYQDNLRPDALVWNSLRVAFARYPDL